MRKFYAYTRVSTTKQGEHGVSLEQQREAIQRYAAKNGFEIAKWFEEQETAAKRGRPVFGQMLKLLRLGKASGVIIHKIDRSARNLKDWADLGELIDAGVEVHFANESLDLNSRGGRLSADIQAVVAADYIRHLREETKKGFWGRLKQGIDPRPAVVGYLDPGPGKPKAVDPVKAHLVRQAFERYATGKYNLDRLTQEMYVLGLRNKGGDRVSKTGLSKILNNPFYIGVIRIKKTNENFPGAHQGIVPVSLFEQVQQLLRSKVNRKMKKNFFLFRQLILCKLCGYCLTAEQQKDHIYYRCHTKGCLTRTIREETLDNALAEQLKQLVFSQEEKEYFWAKISQTKQNWTDQRQQSIKNLQLRKSQLQDRQERLTDAYLDKLIDKEVFEQRKTALLKERCLVEENIKNLSSQSQSIPDRLSEILELAGNALLAYKLANVEEKRELLKTLTSNRTVEGKLPIFTLKSPFDLVAKRFSKTYGGPTRSTRLVWDALIPKLLESLAALPLAG